MRIEYHPEGIEMDIDPDRPWWRRVVDFILRRKPQRYYTVVDMEGCDFEEAREFFAEQDFIYQGTGKVSAAIQGVPFTREQSHENDT